MAEMKKKEQSSSNKLLDWGSKFFDGLTGSSKEIPEAGKKLDTHYAAQNRRQKEQDEEEARKKAEASKKQQEENQKPLTAKQKLDLFYGR